MKIIHVIFSLKIGGSETMLVDILNEQAKTSNSIELIIINDEYNAMLIEKISPRVEITKLGRKKGYNSLWVAVKMNLLLLRRHPDVVHFHDHTGINFLLNKKRYKTLLTLHAMNIDSSNWHKYSCLCAISKAVQKDIRSRSGLGSILIYNGIKLADIKRKESENFGSRIILVGRLDDTIKGQSVLIKAVSILQDKYPESPFSVDIIGEGPSLGYLQELASSLSVNNVSFLGAKDRAFIYKELANYDLFVQPSNEEGFGLTIAEALAANIPVLISNLDGPQEVIDNGKYGERFEAGNSEHCAQKIESILICRQFNIDKNSKDKYISEKFDIHKTAMNYICLYRKVIEQ